MTSFLKETAFTLNIRSIIDFIFVKVFCLVNNSDCERMCALLCLRLLQNKCCGNERAGV
jgi:hypothetical protein